MEEGSRSPFPSPQQKLIESLFTHCCFDSTAIVGLGISTAYRSRLIKILWNIDFYVMLSWLLTELIGNPPRN